MSAYFIVQINVKNQDNYKEYIFSNPNDINFIYNYKIKYITIPIENLISDNKFIILYAARVNHILIGFSPARLNLLV